MPEPPFTKPLGLSFIELQSVDSTNNYARQLIYEGLAQHGTIIFAHDQVAGKGQRNKVWTSEKAANIVLSILIKPQPLLLTEQFQLSACAAVAVQEFFMKYAGDDSKIKWPNDLYWQDRKAGGILIESVVRSSESGVWNQESVAATAGQWDWAIVGIGININQTSFPDDLPNPVSLKQITGKNFDAVALAKELCALLNEKFAELLNHGFENIYSRYLLHLYKRNATVKLKKGSRVFEAMIKEVNTSGQLVVQHSIEEIFDFGNVEWVI